MSDAFVDSLMGETVVHTNALAAVTRNFVVVRYGSGEVRTVIGNEAIRSIRKVTTTRPGLLVISCGLFTIAAASYVSKQGMDVSLAIALIGSLFVMGYVGTRRAAVLFLLENESIESVKGSFRDATSVIRAVNRVRTEASK